MGFLGVAFLWDLSMRIAFRWTFHIGKSHNLTLAEVLVTIAYIIFLLVSHRQILLACSFIIPLAADLEARALYLPYWCNRSGALAVSQFPFFTAWN
jgi:ferric-chelate reductase